MLTTHNIALHVFAGLPPLRDVRIRARITEAKHSSARQKKKKKKKKKKKLTFCDFSVILSKNTTFSLEPTHEAAVLRVFPSFSQQPRLRAPHLKDIVHQIIAR
jgi:hypothetical protein